VATRLIMILLRADGMSPAEIADLLDYHPTTVRRQIHRFTAEGIPGLPDRPRSGRPRLGGASLTRRIAALLNTPGPWTIPRLWQRQTFTGYS
jgi:transposase